MDVWYKTNYFKKSPLVGRRITDAGACDARTNGYGSLQLFSGVLKNFPLFIVSFTEDFSVCSKFTGIAKWQKIVAGFG